MIDTDKAITELADSIIEYQEQCNRTVYRNYAANSLSQYLEITQYVEDCECDAEIEVRISDHDACYESRRGLMRLCVNVTTLNSTYGFKQINRDINKLLAQEIEDLY